MNPWAAPPSLGSTGPAASASSPPLRHDVAAGALTVAALVLLGSPVGLLWSVLAPRAEVVVYGAGKGADFVHGEPREFIGADGSFLVLTLVVGLVVGALAWRLGRRAGPGVVVGLAAGGLLGALVAAKVGTMPGLAAFRQAVVHGPAGHLLAPIRLRASAAVVAWPVGALLGFVLPGFRRRVP